MLGEEHFVNMKISPETELKKIKKGISDLNAPPPPLPHSHLQAPHVPSTGGGYVPSWRVTCNWHALDTGQMANEVRAGATWSLRPSPRSAVASWWGGGVWSVCLGLLELAGGRGNLSVCLFVCCVCLFWGRKGVGEGEDLRGNKKKRWIFLVYVHFVRKV